MAGEVPSPPPRHDIPRNLSYIAGLYERAYYRTQRPSLEEEEEDGEEEVGECEGAAECGHPGRSRGRKTKGQLGSPGARRRARSAPADQTRALAALRSYSPNTRKKVRFADSLGLELITVRHYCQSEMPRIPSHVQEGLRRDSIQHFTVDHVALKVIKKKKKRLCFKETVSPFPGTIKPQHTSKHCSGLFSYQEQSAQLEFLEPLFQSPITEPGFLERVRHQKICLESITLERFSIMGFLRVLNLAFEKDVCIRYSMDHWRSFSDAAAIYLPDPLDRYTDRFAFRLPLPAFLGPGNTMQFALRYRVSGIEYWDNNGGSNYALRHQTIQLSPPKEYENSWIHFI
ncbi:protein phosphatase 1 regulatory subunit 3E [Latimeria chalumnae]|uniref:protein phosphatase 1 regulatory subunit 3E n=1 Tax=Latimeria chalumnae TaxID=7897 RepID=UPI0006D9222A|nr:PREDICTED: protein phosphatase 1 regulatory subunit 3E [Latimeria chalumnae]|eukprot:XP_014354006.1 PREDICTED: protein phosphatase 1 regulatory subunit 3E [Latimeria chalumnae]